MNQKLFTIEEYYLGPKFISCHLDNDRIVNVNRDEFEIWLNYTDRLEYYGWEHDSEEEGENIRKATIEQYYAEWDPRPDLYDFILLYHMDGFNIAEPLHEILKDYNNPEN